MIQSNQIHSPVEIREGVLPRGTRATSKEDKGKQHFLLDMFPFKDLTLDNEFELYDIVKYSKYNLYVYNKDRSKSVGVIYNQGIVLRQKIGNVRRVLYVHKNQYHIEDLFPHIKFEILSEITQDNLEEFRQHLMGVIGGRKLQFGFSNENLTAIF